MITYKYMRARKRWIVPRLKQYGCILICVIFGHTWNEWRVETEEWFEYVYEPVDYGWRSCSNCGLIQQARKTYEAP